MDYKRIYDSFIADRLNKQPSKPDYFERHHIVPRCMGGDNSKSNIIKLTASDHLFAHLLLAKINGGKMWNAVYAMANLLNETTGKHRVYGKRYLFEVMRKQVAEYHKYLFKGPSGPQSDKTKYELKSFNGEIAIGDRFELEAKTGIPRQQISAILRGAKKSAHGWYCVNHNPDGLTPSELLSKALSSGEVFNLFHFDGRTWSGTRQDFFSKFGEKLEFSTKRKTVHGWSKSIEEAKEYLNNRKEIAKKASISRGDISGDKNPMYGVDRRVSRHIRLKHKSGDIYEGCSIKFADSIGMKSPSNYQRMIKTIIGKKVVNGFVIKSFKGWYPLIN